MEKIVIKIKINKATEKAIMNSEEATEAIGEITNTIERLGAAMKGTIHLKAGVIVDDELPLGYEGHVRIPLDKDVMEKIEKSDEANKLFLLLVPQSKKLKEVTTTFQKEQCQKLKKKIFNMQAVILIKEKTTHEGVFLHNTEDRARYLTNEVIQEILYQLPNKAAIDQISEIQIMEYPNKEKNAKCTSFKVKYSSVREIEFLTEKKTGKTV